MSGYRLRIAIYIVSTSGIDDTHLLYEMIANKLLYNAVQTGQNG